MRRLAAASFALLLGGCGTTAPEIAPDAAVMQVQKPSIANIEIAKSPGGVTAWLVSEPFVPIIAMEMVVAWRRAAVEPAAEARRRLGAGAT